MKKLKNIHPGEVLQEEFLIPLDLTQSNDAIYKQTKDMAVEQPGFEMSTDWKKRIGARMNRFVPGL